MELLQNSWLTTAIAGAISSLITWVLSKRMRGAQASNVEGDAKKLELDNIQAAIQIYRKAAEDLQTELKSSREEMAALRTVNESLIQKISEQSTHIETIERKLDEYKHQVDVERKENQKLRQRLNRIDGGAPT